jgi:hypothetical protein
MRTLCVSIITVALLAGSTLGVAGQSEEGAGSPSPGPGPVGVIALGSWGLTGAGSDPDRPPEFAVPENSWATGTSPEIDSIYQRLVAVRPETEGHVSNQARAEGGARSNTLAYQAETALEEVPAPALVIIDIIGPDIRCDGTDEAFVPQFGEYLSETLDVITSTSPESRILMVDLQGRPALFAELLMDYPEIMADYSGTGMCDYFDPEGQLVPEALETEAGIIAAYEAEQARVCTSVPQCHTDGGLMAAWVGEAADFSSDSSLSVEGNAHKAEMLWPVVAEILDLPA